MHRTSKTCACRVAGRAALVALWLLVCPLELPAASAFEDAQAVFVRAEDGETGLIATVEEKFAALLREEPTNPVYRAYHGSAVAQLAYTTVLPWKKIDWVDRGLKELDQALHDLQAAQASRQLRGVPFNLETKLVVGGTLIILPSVYDRFKQGSRLLGEVAKDPGFPATPADFRGSVLLRLAQMHDKLGQDSERDRSIKQAVALVPALANTDHGRELLGKSPAK